MVEGDAAPPGERAHGDAVAEVGDHDAPARHRGRDLGKAVGDVLVA